MGDRNVSGAFERNRPPARDVRKLDNAIHRINHYPRDSVVCFVIHWIAIYPVDNVIQYSNNYGLGY